MSTTTGATPTNEPVYTWRCTLCSTRNKSAGRFERDRRAPCWIGMHPCRGCGVMSWREGVLILQIGVREKKEKPEKEKPEKEKEKKEEKKKEEEEGGGVEGEEEWGYGGGGIIDEDVSMEDVGSLLVPEEGQEEGEREEEEKEEESRPFRVLKKRFEDISTDGSEL